MFCNDIHGDLGKVHVGPDPSGSGDPGLFQDLLDHHPDQVVSAAGIDGSIGSDINEYFVDGIDMNVLSGKEFQVNGIDLGGISDIGRHSRRGDDVVDAKYQVIYLVHCSQLRITFDIQYRVVYIRRK